MLHPSSWALSPAPLASGLLSCHPRPRDGKHSCFPILVQQQSCIWDSAGTKQQLLAAAGAPPSVCSHSHHGDLALPSCHPPRVQQLQPHHGSCVSQLRSQGIWRKSAKWQHFSLLPQHRLFSPLVLGWVRGYPLHWMTSTSQPCRSYSNTKLSSPCLHALSHGGGKRWSWKGQSLQHHVLLLNKQKFWLCLTNFCNGVKICSFIC